MECNREEALKAKEVAERKFLAKDVKGAKKFATKAQMMYPKLEGISQMLMTLGVYISAEEDKRLRESNWYSVLGVTPLDDDETIRKRYIKLCELEKESLQLPNKLSSESSDIKPVERMSVDVPSPDFHDFGNDRTEECFSENQVWAVYDDHDGMPRHYAMIQSVISTNPFKVKIRWLSPVPLMSWFSGGFSRTCGEFRVGRVKICDSTEWFSHIVRWMKQDSTIQIFPRKGDVWALYRNWSSEWNELTEDKEMREYDMVEVLDYDEDLGIIVIPLVKVVGFKTVFHQTLNPMEIRRIPNEEMSRFSHQVPCHLLTVEEGSKVLKGCRELDPAAIPLHFLEVVWNIEEIEFMESGEDIEFVNAVDCYGNTITGVDQGTS